MSIFRKYKRTQEQKLSKKITVESSKPKNRKQRRKQMRQCNG